MLKPQIENNQIQFGERCKITFQRTLRLPEDDQSYPLPPGLGLFSIQRVIDFPNKLPAHWHPDGVFISLFQREALWIGFQGARWKPNVVKIDLGNVNAISGHVNQDQLTQNPQNYVVIPHQLWLDGINTGKDKIRQFVAIPLGKGYTIESAVTGQEVVGGIQIKVYEPNPGIFPDMPPPPSPTSIRPRRPQRSADSMSMGIAAGGQMRQKIYPDPYGIETWDQNNYGVLTVYILNSQQYCDITGHQPTLPPIDAATYTKYGLPWFDIYDENEATLDASQILSDIPSVRERDDILGVEVDSNPSFDVPNSQIKKISDR